MTATPARHTQAPVPDGRRLSGHPDAVASRVAQLAEQAGDAGLVVEQVPRRKDLDGTVVVDVLFTRPAPVETRRPGLQRHSARFWGVVAAAVAVAAATVVWAVVALVQAVVDATSKAAAAAGVILPGLLGLIVILVGLGAAASTKGGGGFSGTFKGHMD